MASLITDHMKADGTKFLHECMPLAIEKDAKSGLYSVKWEKKDKKQSKDVFQTVLFAVGMKIFYHYLEYYVISQSCIAVVPKILDIMDLFMYFLYLAVYEAEITDLF